MGDLNKPSSLSPSKEKAVPHGPELEDDFDAKLASLPERHRAEILRQYDIPNAKVTLFAVLHYATPFEIFLMLVGLLLSIGAGIISMIL